jgi:hypothetical protein
VAYEGWFTYGGAEIINAQRTSAYIKSMLPGVKVHDICGADCSCDHLHRFLGDLPYASPLADDAPWTDADRPESYQFLGAYPLGVENLTDGTVTATLIEGADDGGWVTGRRSRPREVLFSVALFSTTEEGDDYGMSWLKAALEGSCEDETAADQLCFLSACVDPDEWGGRVVKTEHSLADWRLFRSAWQGRTIRLNEQGSWADITMPGSCGDIEWEITVRGEAGNFIALRHDNNPDELFLMDGSAQTIRVTTTGTTLRLGVPDVSDYASWREPDNQAALDAATLADMARHNTTTGTAAGGIQATWEQFTTIPLPVEIIQVISNARFENSDDDCAAEYMRFLRRVSHTDGPRTRRREMLPSGAVIRTVDFVVTAEMPWIYGTPVLAAKGSSEELLPMAVPYRTTRLSQNINDCYEQPIKTVLDPLGPTVPPPPPASLLQLPPEMAPPSKNPYAVLVPASTIPQWLNAVPVVKVTAGTSAVRHVRVRFFPVPLDSYLPSDIDPCAACGSFQIDYLPAGGVFTFDATEHRATVSVGGLEQTAEHLISGDKGVGSPSWPLLSCGIPYMVLIDTREQRLSDVEVYMVVRS